MSRHILLLSAETSGDIFGGEVATALREIDPEIKLSGIGGPNMDAAGIKLLDFDRSGVSILGWWEGIVSYQRILALAARAAEQILAERPDHLVLVDSWGFTLRVARAVRAIAPEIKLTKLIGPQIWASRPGRAKTVAETYDQVLCVLQRELAFYESLNIDARQIGHPAIDRFSEGDARAFRSRYGISDRAQLCLVCPGSRHSEIERVAPNLIASARLLKSRYPGLRIVVAPSKAVSEHCRQAVPPSPDEIWIDDQNELHDAMAAASVSLACSGTITTELACAGVATCVAYRVSPVTFALAKAGFMTTDYVSLLNVAAERAVMPEFLQARLQPNIVAETAGIWLANEDVRCAQVKAQTDALGLLSDIKTPASQMAARALLDLV